MLKKLLPAVATMMATISFAFADVDANLADEETLDSVKGIGPKTSRAIIQEREKGDFKSWADFEKRVGGVGEKSAKKFSDDGLTINGESRTNASAARTDADGARTRTKKDDWNK